jgi:hypothetical protein
VGAAVVAFLLSRLERNQPQVPAELPKVEAPAGGAGNTAEAASPGLPPQDPRSPFRTAVLKLLGTVARACSPVAGSGWAWAALIGAGVLFLALDPSPQGVQRRRSLREGTQQLWASFWFVLEQVWSAYRSVFSHPAS